MIQSGRVSKRPQCVYYAQDRNVGRPRFFPPAHLAPILLWARPAAAASGVCIAAVSSFPRVVARRFVGLVPNES